MNQLLSRLGFLICLMTYTFSAAQENSDARTGNEHALVGEWKIDLRPTPDSEPYFQIFTIEEVNDRTLVGSFYGSPVQDGLINMNWPKLYFAFSTNDSTDGYYHSGYLADGKLFGTTYCPGRDLIARWTGERKE